MKRFETDELPALPWKNGGGVTREIAKRSGPLGFAWRLSVADVAREGDFSSFAGLRRILTVIEGEGLELHAAQAVAELAWCEPHAFSGDTPIRSVLRSGPIRDFNVIYDAALVDARVEVLRGPRRAQFVSGQEHQFAFFGVTGAFKLGDSAANTGTVFVADEGPLSLELSAGARVLVVELVSRSTA